jgi:hypothetical protein
MKRKAKAAPKKRLTVKDLGARKKGAVRGGATVPASQTPTTQPRGITIPKWIVPCV